MATKQRTESTFKVIVRHGTPEHMEDQKTYTNPSLAAKFLTGRLASHREWADRYNHKCRDQLDSIRVEIDSLNMRGLHPGEKRRWEAVDDLYDVHFCFEVEMVSR